MMRMSLLSLVITAGMAGSVAEAQICTATNNTTCPADSTYDHLIEAFCIFGVCTTDGPQHHMLGMLHSNGLAATCTWSGTRWFYEGLIDAHTTTTFTALSTDAHICLGTGGDSIRFATSSFTCGTVAMDAWNPAGHRLTVYGQSGDDDIIASSVFEVNVCGGSDSDEIIGATSYDILDGYSEADYLEAYNSYTPVTIYGGDGDDTVFGRGVSPYETFSISTGAGYDCVSISNYSTLTLDCGADSDKSTVAGTSCETTVTSCPWGGNSTVIPTGP